MIAIAHPITKLLTWRGATVALYPQRHQYFVYLLHFSEPFHHARHYCGETSDIDARLERHRRGDGARLIEVITEHNIGFELVRLWPCNSEEEARSLERLLKAAHHGPRNCPRCNPHLAPDPVCLLRAGHWPFALFDKPGRRQPLQKGVSSCNLSN